MKQTAPVSALHYRMPLPPMRREEIEYPYHQHRYALGALRAGHTPPLRPEQVQSRWPWLYGMPFGIPQDGDPYTGLHNGHALKPLGFQGLGQDSTQQQPQGPTGPQIATSVMAGAAAGITAIKAGKPMQGAGMILMGMTPIPVVGIFAGVAGAAVELLAAIGVGQGCGQTCIQASEYADRAATLMQQNLDTYTGLQAPRAQSLQAQALAVFDQLWQGLVQACSDPSLGDAGRRCISDRQQGACHFHGSDGACWDWFKGYRDPIAKDPNVAPDAQSAQASQLAQEQAMTGGAAGAGSSLGLILGGVLILVALTSKGGAN